MDYTEFGNILRYERTKRGLSQSELAEGICERKQISNIECGKCMPNLYTVNLLSHRLKVNLHRSYANVLHHKNMDTHLKITKINEIISVSGKSVELKALLDKYVLLDDFKDGEPYQMLHYGYASYYYNHCRDYKTTIEHLYNVVLSNYSNEDALINCSTNEFSNVELGALLMLASTLLKEGEKAKSQVYYNKLFDYLCRFLSQDKYYINAEGHFELNFIGKVIFNYTIDFQDKVCEIESWIDMTLSALRKFDSACNITEILLCKAKLLRTKGNESETARILAQADWVGSLYRSEEYIKRLKDQLGLG